ncbi:tetraspanin-15 [Erpetoichthys calabaricus]|uniref:tetraspanin-15 n=1 Tax=Erpetoichthys calabaricus TaxID=27687 RepID=UPI002234128F|nr:tetraspanin-15 [Erpetoichthys calabaricus]
MPLCSKGKHPLLYYYCIKFTLNVYSIFFWLVGLVVLCIGIYAEIERQKNTTVEGLFLAPAVILILLGIIMFSVSLVGMVGSLRDNKTLLHVFLCVLSVLLVLQAIALIIALVFGNKTAAVFQSSIREGIKHYYDDLDFKNILDFVQEKLSCCGGDEYKDWAVNHYHSCNGTGPLSCGVPYTCCINKKEAGAVVNTLCGYKTLDKERLEVNDIIYVRGCIHAVNLWFGDNIGISFSLCCAVVLPQLFGIIMSCLFWSKLKEMSESTDAVDFRIRGLGEYNFSELDLSGAGWCLCLPRDGGYLPVPEAEPWDQKCEDLPIETAPAPTPRKPLESSGNLHLYQGFDEIDQAF